VERRTGKVTDLKGEFGFIASDDGERGIYFKLNWFRGAVPTVDDLVTFELKDFNGKLQAHRPRLITDASSNNERGSSDYLLDWAFLGRLPNTLLG